MLENMRKNEKKGEENKIFDYNLTTNLSLFKLYAFFKKLVTKHRDGY